MNTNNENVSVFLHKTETLNALHTAGLVLFDLHSFKKKVREFL